MKMQGSEEDSEESEILSDAAFWDASHTGFNFGENEWQPPVRSSKLSSDIRKNERLNCLEHLRCGGLNEVAENKTPSEELLTAHLSTEEIKQANKIAKSCNPLELHLKESGGRKKLSAAETITNMILGLEYDLKQFKGKDEKIELLNEAVQSHDGNAILLVVLFLKSTLKKSIFQRELGMLPDAVNTYLSYLQEDHESDELANMLLLLNRAEEAAMIKYEAANLAQTPERKSMLIQNCLDTHFQPGTVHQLLRETVLEHKASIEDQIILEDHKISSEMNTDEVAQLFEELTGGKLLVDSSSMCSLIFSLLYFPTVSDIALISSQTIRTRYKFSNKQFLWCAVRVFAATKSWKDIEDLFLSKTWLGVSKMRSHIGFVRVLEILSKHKAPEEEMKKYVRCLENQDLKLFFAKKYKCHSIVIEIFKKKRDRKSLMEYKASLPPHSVDFCHATSVLNNDPVTWKN